MTDRFRLRRLPVRSRLVVGFTAAMLVVLACAGAFVFWRVQVSLDSRLDQDLHDDSADLARAAVHLPPAAAIASLRDEGREAQLLDRNGRILASGVGLAAGTRLLDAAHLRRALVRPVRTSHGFLFSPRGKHVRILAVPVDGQGGATVAVAAVSLSQRDEALRELLAQLGIADLLAVLVAAAVAYGFAHVALDPVERYRAQAERIAGGATGVRLDVPEGPSDEITKLGRTLNEMVDALELSVQRQQQFIDDASHELRTPLTTLAAEVDLALRKPRSAEEYEQTLHRIATDTGRLLELAETLLTLGALGSRVASPGPVSVADLLADSARRATAQLDGCGREVVVQESDLTVPGDRVLLLSALGNLVDNAVRYGRDTISLGAAVLGRAGPVALSVHDGGRIDADFLAHAAERFTQGASSRSDEGAGLGLALVDAIAAAHGGQLRICSDGRHHLQPSRDRTLATVTCRHPAAGTTVTLLLPARPGASDASATGTVGRTSMKRVRRTSRVERSGRTP